MEEDATGATMVYSGDTGPSEALVQLANNVDLLLVESAFSMPGQSSGDASLRRPSRRDRAGRRSPCVVLTHIPPWHEPERVLAEANLTSTGLFRSRCPEPFGTSVCLG